MSWIYVIFIQIFMFLVLIIPGSSKMLFLGLEIGVIIGQIIFVINENRR